MLEVGTAQSFIAKAVTLWGLTMQHGPEMDGKINDIDQ